MTDSPKRPTGLLRTPLLAVAGLVVALLPASALAGDAVVTPLVARGIDPLVALNMTSLISSELDFMGQYDNVDQLTEVPKGLNSGCLNSASCLGGIAKSNGAQAVVTGALAQVGNKFDFFLVLYDNGRIVRTIEFTLPNVPSVIADSMSGRVKQLVTGDKPGDQNTAAAAVVDAGAFDDFGEDDGMDVIDPGGGNSRRIATPGGSGDRHQELDDFDLDSDPDEDRRRAAAAEEEDRRAAAAAAAAEEDRRRKAAAEEEERRRAAAAAAAEEDRRRKAAAEEDRRRKAAAAAAEEERRRKAEEEEERRATAVAATTEADEDEDDFDFDFGGGVAVVDEEPEDEDRRGGAVAVVEDDPPERGRYDLDEGSSRGRDRDRGSSRDRVASSSRDRDRDADRRSSSRSSREDLDGGSRARKDKTDTADTKAGIAIRAGYSRFQDLNFVTYGAEASFMATPNLAIVAGAEAYSTRRRIETTDDSGGDVQLIEEWNTIMPLNAGVQYKFGASNIRPYVGGGLQVIPGVVKDQGGVAIGLRARGGVDFAITEAFGFNLNMAAGMWSGQQFEQIQQGFNTSALVPQFSAGTIILF